MEYLLRVNKLKFQDHDKRRVLILIVMEYLLRVNNAVDNFDAPVSLNPYCYGIPSQRCYWKIWESSIQSLNPYCYGIPSQSMIMSIPKFSKFVKS